MLITKKCLAWNCLWNENTSDQLENWGLLSSYCIKQPIKWETDETDWLVDKISW